MATFFNSLSDSPSSVACFIARMHSTAMVPVTAAPNITPTKNDFKGDIFDLGNKLLRSFDISGFGVLLLMMAELLVSQGLISGPLVNDYGFIMNGHVRCLMK